MKLNIPLKVNLLFSVLFIFFKSYSQEWTFMGGTSLTAQFCNYGTMGTAAASNMLGARVTMGHWKDNSGNFWVFGGNGYSASAGSLVGNSDLWKYDLSSNQWTWVKGPTINDQQGIYGTQGTPAPSNNPGGREYQGSWTDNAGNLWLYGGYGADISSGGYLSDLWKYNITTNDWTWVHGSSTANAAAVYGTQGVPAAANTPGKRANPITWKDNNGDLWLFGGETLIANFGDLWKYSISLNQWTWMGGSTTTNQPGVYGTQGVAAAGNIPGARRVGAGWTDNAGDFWMFGGTGYGSTATAGSLNDLWKYNVSTGQWTWMKGASTVNAAGSYGSVGVSAAANVPGARWSAAPFKDTNGNLWLFGGEGYATTAVGRLNDLWKYNITTNEWTWIKGGNIINQAGVYGTMGVSAPANTPTSKWGVASWVDNNGVFWTFGGNFSANGHMNDLWKYVICSYVPLAPIDNTSLSNQNICVGNTAVLTAASGVNTINWFAGPTSTTVLGTGTNFTTASLPAGSYSVYAEATSCQVNPNRTTVIFNVNALPNINVNSGEICAGNTFTLLPSGASTYTIYSGSATATPSSTITAYSVTGTSIFGCVSSNAAVAMVTINALPVVTVNSGSVCSGNTFTMVPTGADTYTYSNGFDVVTPSVTTSYTVTGMDQNGCVSLPVISDVTVNPTPMLATVGSSALICKGESAALTVSGANSYTWSTGSNVASIIVNPTVTTQYTVTGMSAGCYKTTTVIQNVNECTGINAQQLVAGIMIYPNPTSGDFTIQSSEAMSLQLINNLGQLVRLIDLNEEQNKVMIANLSDGIYFITGVTRNGQVNQKIVVSK